MRVRKRNRLVLLTAVGLTLGGLAFSSGNTGIAYADDNGPQTIQTNNAEKTFVTVSSGKLYAQYEGQWKEGYGYHRVNIIKQPRSGGGTRREDYIFCINWSKNAPSKKTLVRQYQADPAVQWLVTDFYKGHDKSFESLDNAGTDYNLADYWLYQTAVHLVACPNEVSPIDGKKPGDTLDKFAPQVRNKVLRLVAEAKKHKTESESEIVENHATLNFDPSTLNIGSRDMRNNKYEKGFKVKTDQMHDVQVHAADSKNEKYLSGTRKNGGKVDFNNVNADDNLKISVPYGDLTNTSDLSFKVKATGHWNKRAKVAWIYWNGNPNEQHVAKLGTKAVTVPMEGDTEMTVHVKPAFGKISFVKKGSGDNNNKLLPGTEFLLTSSGFSERKTVDSNGRVTFDSLPLGKKYHLKEIKQPNGQYNGNYERDIDALAGNNPQKDVDLGTIINDKKHQKFTIKKQDINSKGIGGAQFVLIRKNQYEPLNITSPAQAKQQALRQVNGELVTGHSNQQPYIATTDSNGNTVFDNVLINPQDPPYDYYAVEVKSPNGYALSLTPIKFDAMSKTSPDTVSGTMKNTTQPIPTTGSKELLMQSVTGAVVVLTIGSYAYYESKKEK